MGWRAKLPAGLVRREQGDFVGAEEMLEECLAFHRTLGDDEGIAVGLLGLGDIARDQGDAAQLRRYCEERLARSRKLGVQWAIGFALNNLALGAYQERDLTRAFGVVSESIALFQAQQADASVAEVLITLGQIQRVQGDVAGAYAALTEALRHRRYARRWTPRSGLSINLPWSRRWQPSEQRLATTPSQLCGRRRRRWRLNRCSAPSPAWHRSLRPAIHQEARTSWPIPLTQLLYHV
jgi:hypothetical protein